MCRFILDPEQDLIPRNQQKPQIKDKKAEINENPVKNSNEKDKERVKVIRWRDELLS